MVIPSDAELLSRLRNFEDHFVERKTIADDKDALKTVVAFANSAPVDFPCVLYIGVRDDGQFETRPCDCDSIQKTLNVMLQKIYPRAAYYPKVITDGSNTALAVIIPGSANRPHFAGPSYVRQGSETKEASESQFETLIATRTTKAYRIASHIGKAVTVVNKSPVGNGTFTRSTWPTLPIVIECNESWVTLQVPKASLSSYMLGDVELNYDHAGNRLQLEITTREF